MGSQESVTPATPAQLKLYTHARVFPRDPSFNLGGTFHITGPVDVDRLRTVIGRLGAGIRALNTSFEERGGIVYAVHRVPHIADPADLVTVTELHGEGLREAPRRFAATADRPIPPEAPRQYDFEIFRAPDGVFVTLLFSHLICDAYTFYMFVTELERLYADPDAELTPAALDEPGSLVTGAAPASSAAVDFFRKRLGGVTTFSDDRLQGSRSAGGALRGHQRHLILTEEESGLIRARAEDIGVSPFAFFLGAYLLVHARVTGRREVVTGLPLANRRGIRQRKASGYFVNILPLAVDLAGYDTFGELCRDVQETTLGMLRYQGFDVAAQVREVCPGAEGGSLAFNSAFTYYKQPLQIRIPGCSIESIELPRRYAKYPLVMNVEDFGSSFNVNVECSEEQWGTDPLACMRQVLETVSAAGADVPLRDIPAMPPEAERELSRRINPGARVVDDGPFPSLTTWFSDVARTHAERVAVRDGDESVTYAELDARADRVAHALGREVPGEHVGVAMRRGSDLLAVILGVLKAGKAYVPLDPGSPASRVGRILESFPDGLPVVADEERWPDRAVRHLDASALLAPGEPVPGPEPVKDPDACAYTIFTSGSTGRPKGVQVTHRNVVRLFRACEEHFDFGPDDVWSLFHSYAFDFSVWEIFGALLYGGQVVVVPADTARSPQQFRDFLAEYGVTVLNQTPSAFGQLLKVLRPGDRSALDVRYVVFGGEPLRYAALRPWYELMGEQARLVNMYGITETTVHVTHHAVTPADALMEKSSLIGRPLADLTVSVVDGEGRHCPPGVPGELVVAGPGVALGYLGRPDLTSERFVVADGVTAYRSGDLGLARPDGSLVHLGRMDGQVQLRGFRIELGEVESALLSVDGVRETAVRLDDRDPGHPSLVAFVVDSAAVPDDRTLLRLLRERLPAYMVPARTVRLTALPLTVNGKVDDAALPWPSPGDAAPAPLERTPPGRTTTDLVRSVWSHVLPGVSVGEDDNFFDIGGSSMHVADVHARLQDQLPGVPLDMIALFTHTTVRRLAAHIDTLGADGRAPGAAGSAAAQEGANQ
ncbi:amino acid adenylation domain-containing protein [Streptomyces wuyuanensis]|uniref:amino acid adenylation domain-containing protein n=1 Tax=Streptomyces wuyuanensis TaxID=1196353 RepID=UPI0037B88F3C